MLSENERKILQTLRKIGKASITDLERETGLPRSTIMALIESLKQKNAIKIYEKTRKHLKLTREGEIRALQGLPEKIIAHKTWESGGELKIKEVPSVTGLSQEEVRIGLGWLRRKGLGKIVKGKVVVHEKPPTELDEEKLLRKIYVAKTINLEALKPEERRAIKELVSRKLVEELEKKEYIIEITDEGLKLLEEEKEYITIITHDIIKRKEWLKKEIKPYNVKAEPPKVYPGRKHFYIEFLDEIREILVSMGFTEAEGPIVEVELWNFDVLFQPQDHPAREIHDTFRLKYPERKPVETEVAEKVKIVHETGGASGSRGWGYVWDRRISERLILRTQTTSVSARFLYVNREPPVKMFTIGKVYRPDTIDAKHLPEFHQLDGIVMDRGLHFRNLLGILKEFFKQLGIEAVKFKPSYFPFTEPSVEGYIYHPRVGWVECFGAGMFRPEVLEMLGVKYPTAAWGIGIDRVAMVILGIDDIRDLYSQDINFLRNRKVFMR